MKIIIKKYIQKYIKIILLDYSKTQGKIESLKNAQNTTSENVAGRRIIASQH
jgi:hypothetical protein